MSSDCVKLQYDCNCYTNTCRCTAVFSLSRKKWVKWYYGGKLQPITYILCPGVYIFVKWRHWNKAAPRNWTRIELAQLRVENNSAVVKTIAYVDVEFDHVDDLVQHLPAEVYMLVKSFYEARPRYHSPNAPSTTLDIIDVESLKSWIVENHGRVYTVVPTD